MTTNRNNLASDTTFAVGPVRILADCIVDLEKDVAVRGEQRAFAALGYTFNDFFTWVTGLAMEQIGIVHELFCEMVRPLMLQADLVSYVLERPRGYVGDFGAMERIFLGCTRPEEHAYRGTTRLGKLLNRFVMDFDNSKANVTRVDILARALAGVPAGACIGSFGSGSAIELDLALGAGHCRDAEIHLFDQDDEAHEAARKRLATHGVVPQCHPQSVVRSLLGYSGRPFDFAYSTGMFDYFKTETATKIINRIWPKITAGGSLVVTNAHPDNPTRLPMEWVSNWELVYKTSSEMRGLAAGLPNVSRSELMMDPHKVYQYLTVEKAG